MQKLQIIKLCVETAEGQRILSDVSVEFEGGGKCYAILGPNGSGKSTLISAIMGHPHYRITSGSILLDGRNITNLPTEEKARLGLFLGMQYPAEIEGVSFSQFMRATIHAQNSARDDKVNFYDVLRDLPQWADDLGFRKFDSLRDLNVGFSGGEKKRSEILQMLALRPTFAFLDEPDSGLDVDGLTALSNKLATLDFPAALVVVTHQNKLLEMLKPDMVYVMKNGRVVANGGAELIKKIQKTSFKEF